MGPDTGSRRAEAFKRFEVAGDRVRARRRLWEGLMGGLVRHGAIVLAQPEPVRARIRAAFEELAEAHRGPGGSVELPAVVKIGSGRR